jgi:glycosyltransferase involved in cell wall biosynthesis
MKIGIDARLYGLENAGIGRYITNLVDQLVETDSSNQYHLFVKKDYADLFADYDNVEVSVINTPHYSVREQLINWKKYQLDLLHVPHFNAPLAYSGKLVLTIHDLIKHHSTGAETTTRNQALYGVKRLGYLTLTKLVAKRADKIICPSNWVRDDIVKTLKVNPDRIEVIYEAVAADFGTAVGEVETKKLMASHKLSKPFLVYTGSIYPHKNVDLLLEAIKRRNQISELDFSLAVVCARNIFWQRLETKVKQMGLEADVKLLGFLSDQELAGLYKHAYALVQPSKMEGFGLTGLEAMKLGLPVLAAKATCLPEIYGDAAVYFNPNSVDDFIDKLSKITQNRRLYQELSLKGKKHVKNFSWKKAAKETIAVYKAA